MKNLKLGTFCVLMSFLFFNCSTEAIDSETQNLVQTESISSDFPETNCANQEPIARLLNNGSLHFDLEIFDEEGQLLYSVYNIHPGTSTDWVDLPVGQITFNVSNSNSSKPVVLDMGNCMAYEMEIGSNNQLMSDQPIHL